jgi:hypothetical protein
VLLADGESTTVSSGVIRLPADVPLLNEDNAFFVFVRQAYRDMYITLNGMHQNNVQGCVVSGNPGIGKSVGFGNYLLWRCMKERRTVVFEHVKKEITYVMNFADRSCREFEGRRPNERVVPELRFPGTWYIVDPGDKASPDNPVQCHAFSLTLSSPDTRHFGEFFKRVGRQEYLPVLSEGELVAMSAYVWPGEDPVNRARTVSKRMAVAGGLARWVLADEAKYLSYPNEIQIAVASMSCDIDQFLGTFSAGLICNSLSLGASSFHDHRSRHRLLHLAEVGLNDDGTTQLTMKWASPYVEELLGRAISNAKDATVIRLACSMAPGMETLRGAAYELRMHALLSKGDSFSVRALAPFNSKKSAVKEFTSLVIPPRTVDHFSGLDKIVKFKLDCYYRPQSEKFVSTDAFEFVASGVESSKTVILRSFQATVAQRHPLKTEGLSKILAAVAQMELDWKVTEIHHFIVAPPDRADLYVNEKLTDENNVVGGSVKIVEQVLVLHPNRTELPDCTEDEKKK